MLKKPYIFGIVFVFLVFALFAVSAQSGNKAQTQSKKSHAERLWKQSGHADVTAEAFIHWDEDGAVSASCAKCHTTAGFKDFLADGSVDSDAPITPKGIRCDACHTSEEGGTVRQHTSVVFPSGEIVENLGPEALCMECHQGRASTNSVDSAIAGANLANDDTPSRSLRFINIHYYGAAASQMGTLTKGGYQYSGKTYDARFSHVDGYNACNTCHNPHRPLPIDLIRCNTCHTWNLSSDKLDFFKGITDPHDIRFYGSFVDYDGDEDMDEGIYWEIETMKQKLYATIQAYGNEIGYPIVYDAHAYPYFFYDTNGNGIADESEAVSANQYRSFTARLLRAVYNFQTAMKDPGAYAHGGKYIIEFLYDSMEDLNSVLTSPVSMAGMHRTDEGHFDGSAEAWRHWDEDGEVSSSCARCHSATGLAYFLEHGENQAEPISNGMLCTTCHTSPPAVRRAAQVTFPSGIVKNLGDNSNICMVCHQGRESKASVDRRTSSSAGPYSFINIHYFPAAAVLFGSEVHGGYEYEGKIYMGRQTFPNHNGRFDTCVECHMSSKGLFADGSKPYSSHFVEKPNPEDCVFCHGQDVSQPNPGADPKKFKFSGIRPGSIPDFDSDGNMQESIKDEIQGLEAALYAQIQIYAANVLNVPVIYDPSGYPYFFNDTNANGEVDAGEANYGNRYRMFDAPLLRAAYNLQLSKKEPHGFIHNAFYVAQLLVDSIGHLGGDTSAYTWR